MAWRSIIWCDEHGAAICKCNNQFAIDALYNDKEEILASVHQSQDNLFYGHLAPVPPSINNHGWKFPQVNLSPRPNVLDAKAAVEYYLEKRA